MQSMARVSTVAAGSTTLAVVVGPRQFIADQLLGKADVIRAMHERVQLCQDPQTEFALPRGSLGVSRIIHMLRVHGHTILQDQRAAEIYDEVGQQSLERLFPDFTEDSMVQATLSAGQFRIGHKRARDIAAPAHLGALTAARARVQAMIQDAVWAGLLLEHLQETRLSAVLHLSQRRRSSHGKVVCPEGHSGGRRSLAASKCRASQNRPSPPPPKMKTVTIRQRTSCGFMATQSWRNKVQRRFTTKLGNGPSNGSSLISRRTA